MGQLIIDNEIECHCSCGEWSFSEVKPDDMLDELWQHHRQTLFTEHFRRRHVGRRRKVRHEELKYKGAAQ